MMDHCILRVKYIRNLSNLLLVYICTCGVCILKIIYGIPLESHVFRETLW